MKALSENRRARFDYEVSDTFEAGIELMGFEVKSAKSGRMQLAGSYAIIRGGEAWLINSQIPPYQPNNTPAGYEPSHPRRLLLHRDEIKKLIGALKAKAFLIPLRAYLKNGFVKIELGLGKPRKKSDKRELLKKRAAEKEMKKFET
jgi:SsrA-binding protein